MQADLRWRVLGVTVGLGVALSGVGCVRSMLWQYAGHELVRDESAPGFELVQGYGCASKAGDLMPCETIIRRIDGRTGAVLCQNRTWGRPAPNPWAVFGWKGEFVAYDDRVGLLVRSSNVLSRREFVNPTDLLLDAVSLNIFAGAAEQHELKLVGSLVRRYPNPLIVVPLADGRRIIYSVDLDAMTSAEIALPQPAEEVDVFDDMLVIRDNAMLTGYSLQGARRWQVPILPDEQLPSGNLPPWLNACVHFRVHSELFVTTCGSSKQRDSVVVVRRAADGAVAWRKNIDDAQPERALALGPYVVFVGSRVYPTIIQGQPGSRYESHWWVWDVTGNELAKGVEPTWKAEYAFRGSGAATSVNVAFDARRNTMVVGCGLDAVLIRDGRVIRPLTDIPGEPLSLEDDVLVCRSETGHFAVRIDGSR